MTAMRKRSYKTLSSSDRLFTFSPDGVTLVPRASIVIDQSCPSNITELMTQAYNMGWIKCVAHIPDVEYTIELLREES